MASPLVLILNYRTARLTLECVDSLLPELRDAGAELLVVDNGSPLDEAEELRRGLEQRGCAKAWLRLDRNYGFAGGIVRAVTLHDWNFLWLLNSDTRVESGALRELRSALEKEPRAGAAASRLESFGGKVWQGAFAFPSLVSEWERGARTQALSRRLALPTASDSAVWTEPTEVDWVPGASLLIRREAWDEAGPLSDDYFLYFEDVDWCRRLAAIGWLRLYVPASRVLHHIGGSQSKARTPELWLAARRQYWVRHHGIVAWWLAEGAWFLGRSAAWLRSWARGTLLQHGLRR